MNSLDKLVQITKNFNKELEEASREKRIDIIAQNGNDGYHYNLDGELDNPKKSVSKDRKVCLFTLVYLLTSQML